MLSCSFAEKEPVVWALVHTPGALRSEFSPHFLDGGALMCDVEIAAPAPLEKIIVEGVKSL